MAEPLQVDFKPTELADAVRCSVPFASQVISGAKPLPRAMAIKIYRWKKIKLGPIANATDEQIKTLELFEAKAA